MPLIKVKRQVLNKQLTSKLACSASHPHYSALLHALVGPRKRERERKGLCERCTWSSLPNVAINFRTLQLISKAHSLLFCSRFPIISVFRTTIYCTPIKNRNVHNPSIGNKAFVLQREERSHFDDNARVKNKKS